VEHRRSDNQRRNTKNTCQRQAGIAEAVQGQQNGAVRIIGEAANRLPDDFKKEHSNLEWHKIVGLRHRIVHDYFGIDIEIIWQILSKDLPELRHKLTQV